VVCSNDHLMAIRRRERAPSTTPQADIAGLITTKPGCWYHHRAI
jgi:hypothetical protein